MNYGSLASSWHRTSAAPASDLHERLSDLRHSSSAAASGSQPVNVTSRTTLLLPTGNATTTTIDVQPTWQAPIPPQLLTRNNQHWNNRRLLRFGLYLGSCNVLWYCNALIYILALLTSIILLSIGWSDQTTCKPNLHFFYAVLFTRSFFGLRLAFWSTHHNFHDVIQVDSYFKASWDLVLALTAIVMITSVDGSDCPAKSPVLWVGAIVWSYILAAGYIMRNVLWLATKLASRYAPDIVYIYTRSFYHLTVCGSAFQGRFESTSGMTQLELESIPVVVYTSDLLPAEDAVCVICLQNYSVGEQLRVLACGHHFHAGACIDRWLVRKPACPICVREVSTGATTRQSSSANRTPASHSSTTRATSNSSHQHRTQQVPAAQFSQLPSYQHS